MDVLAHCSVQQCIQACAIVHMRTDIACPTMWLTSAHISFPFNNVQVRSIGQRIHLPLVVSDGYDICFTQLLHAQELTIVSR